MYRKIKGQYKGVFECFKLYWSAYGGIKALLSSPYLHFSIFFSFVCWLGFQNVYPDVKWYDICISVLPNVLGFTLGGYALLMAFGDEKFRFLLAGTTKEEPISPFFELNASFLHFIILQIISLLYGIVSLIWEIADGWAAWFGLTLFIYSLSAALAAAFAVLRTARWYDIYVKGQRDRDPEK